MVLARVMRVSVLWMVLSFRHTCGSCGDVVGLCVLIFTSHSSSASSLHVSNIEQQRIAACTKSLLTTCRRIRSELWVTSHKSIHQRWECSSSTLFRGKIEGTCDTNSPLLRTRRGYSAVEPCLVVASEESRQSAFVYASHTQASIWRLDHRHGPLAIARWSSITYGRMTIPQA